MDSKNNVRSGKAVLIYDGNCPVCSGIAKWIKDHEQKDSIEMLACQSDDVKKRYPLIEEAVCIQAMQLVLPHGGVLAGERRCRRYSNVLNDTGLRRHYLNCRERTSWPVSSTDGLRVGDTTSRKYYSRTKGTIGIMTVKGVLINNIPF